MEINRPHIWYKCQHILVNNKFYCGFAMKEIRLKTWEAQHDFWSNQWLDRFKWLDRIREVIDDQTDQSSPIFKTFVKDRASTQ